MLSYAIALSIHIIGFVVWFAALFYLVRLFIYHVEAQDKPTMEKAILTAQFALMERRLWYGIAWPGAMITLLAGLYLLYITKAYFEGWFHIKAIFLILLFAYHDRCGRMRRQMSEGEYKWSSNQLRLFNELATVLLVAIVFTVMLKKIHLILWALLGFILFGLLLFLAVKGMKGRWRKN